MEPVTHILTGACLSRTGLNRRAAYTTLAMAVAAELPDIDTLWSLRGPVTGFEHHRGITHTFVAVPVEAAIVVGAIYAVHRWRLHKSASTSNEIPHPERSEGSQYSANSGNTSSLGQRSLTTAPINWLLLYAFTLLALLSHLFLDFTNNYGLRPFFPFDPHWYAASIVFIFDPLIFLLLLSALILPPLFRLVSSEVGARRQPFVARGWAITALLLIVVLWTLRETQHNRALQLAMAQSLAAPQPVPVTDASASPDTPAPADPTPIYLQAQRALASPDPLSPFRWYTVTDFGPLYQLGEANTINAVLTPSQYTQPKLNPSPVLTAAESSLLGRTYLDWSSMTFITITPASELGLDDSGNRAAAGHTLVQFADPRFMGDVPILHSATHTPLTGKVELDAANHVVSQSMDGKPQRP